MSLEQRVALKRHRSFLPYPLPYRMFLGLVLLLASIVLASCDREPTEPNVPRRQIKLHQNWRIQPGDTIGSYSVISSLGDISIHLQGKSVYAPFQGRVEPNTSRCVIFSSSELPAYLFRLCGLSKPRLGTVKSGQKIGSGDSLQFAALRKQSNDTWAFVEPAQSILEKFLLKSP